MLNDLLHLRHSSQSRVKHDVHNFEFSLKTDSLAARLLLSCAYDLPQGEDLAPRIFYRKFINCLLKHWELCRSDISKQKNRYKKKMVETKKSCSKYEKLAKKTCGKPYPPSLNSFGVIQRFSGRGGWAEGIGGGSKAYLGLKRDKRLKTI